MFKTLFITITLLLATPAFAASASTQSSTTPLPSDAKILGFASEAALATFSYGFNDINKKLPLLAHYFSNDAWQKYYDTLKKTGQVDRIISNEFIMRASVTKKPSVLSSGRDNPEHAWLIQVPLFVQYVSAHDKVAGNVMVTMSVIPAPQKQKNGLEIKQFVVEAVAN